MCTEYSHFFVLMPTHFVLQVKSQKTSPILYGSVVQFLLYGNYKEDVYATGGEVEVALVRTQLMSLYLEKVTNASLTFFSHVIFFIFAILLHSPKLA